MACSLIKVILACHLDGRLEMCAFDPIYIFIYKIFLICCDLGDLFVEFVLSLSGTSLRIKCVMLSDQICGFKFSK